MCAGFVVIILHKKICVCDYAYIIGICVCVCVCAGKTSAEHAHAVICALMPNQITCQLEPDLPINIYSRDSHVLVSFFLQKYKE